jgi:type II secretory pathway component PulC
MAITFASFKNWRKSSVESGREQFWRDALAEPQRLLLGGCLLVFLLLIGWELWLAVGAALYRPAEHTAAAAANNAHEDDVKRIAAAQLFGNAPGQTGADAAPETTLQLTLRGVFAASDPQQASAIIETGDGKARIVKVGSSIADDTVLRQVYDNRVVLAHNGATESLYFPTPLDTGAGNIAPATEGQDEDGNTPAPANSELTQDQKRANILRRLEELRARAH